MQKDDWMGIDLLPYRDTNFQVSTLPQSQANDFIVSAPVNNWIVIVTTCKVNKTSYIIISQATWQLY